MISDAEYVAARLAQLDAEQVKPDPACWTWPVPDEDTAAQRFYAFHEGLDGVERCAGCGASSPRLVLDHDHITGHERGLLCRSCNGREPGAEPDEMLGKYRRRPPAAIVGHVRMYTDPITRTTPVDPPPDEVWSSSLRCAYALPGVDS